MQRMPARGRREGRMEEFARMRRGRMRRGRMRRRRMRGGSMSGGGVPCDRTGEGLTSRNRNHPARHDLYL